MARRGRRTLTAKLLYEAVNLACAAQKEYFRIKNYTSGGNGSGQPLKVLDTMAEMKGLSVDYWLAVLTAAKRGQRHLPFELTN